MTRRFPPGAVTLPTYRVHYQRVLDLVGASQPTLRWDTFRDAFQSFIRNPESGEEYGRGWVKRTISDLETAAFVRRQATTDHPAASSDKPVEVATLWPTGQNFRAGDITFEEFIWRSIKRGWVLEGNAPEKVEGLEHVIKVLLDADGPLEPGDIERILLKEYDYEFSEAGIRGYPNVLQLLGAIRREDDGYRPTSDAETYLQRFRNMDLFRSFERWMQWERPTGDLPSETTKRDLAKYYMYRESGGWGKQTGWLKSFWREYVAPQARTGETARPHLKRSDTYRAAANEREELRETIKETHEIDSDRLRGLPTTNLQRMADAESAMEARRIRAASGQALSRADLELLETSSRAPYTFPEEFELYAWQEEAVETWYSNDESRTGIAQVVTGAGKTVMALAVIQRWLDEHPDGVASVVVPTKVLMQQWLTEFVEKLNVPMDDIGWAGAGNRDSFADGRRILVSIVNTAVKNDYLRETLAAAGDPPHLLVADECHRYTSEVFSNIFEYPRTASLGLSATPTSTPVLDDTSDRQDAEDHSDAGWTDDDLSPGDKLLFEELGEIFYSLTYGEALEDGLIPPFEVNYIGFKLTQSERGQYDAFSRKVSDAVSDIEMRYGDRLYQLAGPYAQKLNTIRNSTDSETPAIGDFFEYTQKRRELVANAVARQSITLDILQDAMAQEEKSIVFQERIKQLEQLIAPHERRGRNPRTGELADEVSSRQELYQRYPSLKDVDLAVEELFDDPNFKPVMYHSGHSRARWNDFAMEWFRDDGFANTMLSVKALIEGVDVPSADVGIIRVSSSSLRQRIQTLGRILRTGENATKRSKLYVLYARDTVDEHLFREYDWDAQLANAEINHLYWQPQDGGALHGEIVPADEPLPSGGDEWEAPTIPDAEDLEPGDHYDGLRRGFEFSVDSEGRPFRKTENGRQYVTTPAIEEVASTVRRLKGGGAVVVNEANHLVTMTDDGPIFLGVAPDPDEWTYEEQTTGLTKGGSGEAPDWL
jgi:superfamily II DNA or RNA helicase